MENMVSIISFIILILGFGFVFNRKAVELVPVSFSFIILIMYFLAYGYHLAITPFVLLFVGIGSLINSFLYCKYPLQEFVEYIKEQFQGPGIYIAILLGSIMLISSSNRIFMVNDDIRYWGAAVKNLWIRGGYEPLNASFNPNFGDYPQGLMLILCWFLSIGGKFSEGVCHIGFILFALSFILPLFDTVKFKHRFVYFLYVPIAAVLIYTVSTSYTRFGIALEPDRAMALLYAGALLSLVLDYEFDAFTFIRTGLICVALTLMKSVGIIWASFALIFFFICLLKNREFQEDKRKIYGFIAAVASPFLVFLLWNRFCSIMNRTTIHTQSGLNAAYSIGDWPKIISERGFIIKMFFENFFTRSLNCVSFEQNYKAYGINLSPIAFVILFALLAILFKHLCKRYSGTVTFKTALVYSAVVGVIYHIVLLWSYLFIFWEEFDEKNPLHMQNMTSHYVGPVYIGTLLLILVFFVRYSDDEANTLEKKIENNENPNYRKYKKQGNRIVITNVIPFVVMGLISNYPFTYHYLFGYQEDKKNALEIRANMEKALDPFFSITRNLSDINSTRVAFVTDSYDSWLKAYLYFDGVPLSIYYGKLNNPDLEQEIRDSRSEYIYLFSDNKDLEYNYDGKIAKVDELLSLRE